MKSKTPAERFRPIVDALLRPIVARLSRMEGLLIEIRAEQDTKIKKLKKLQQQFDELAAAVKRRLS
jgi:hypothetical protein